MIAELWEDLNACGDTSNGHQHTPQSSLINGDVALDADELMVTPEAMAKPPNKTIVPANVKVMNQYQHQPNQKRKHQLLRLWQIH